MRPTPVAAPAWRSTSFRLGLVIILGALAVAVPLFLKARVATFLTPGEVLVVHFAADLQLKPYETDAKIAGVPVGAVTSTYRADDGSAVVEVKISDGAFNALGNAPSAAVRPTTLLGGRYYVDLVPGGLNGKPSGDIPLARTRLPVELEHLAAALPPSARRGAQGTVASLDATWKSGGDQALRQLLADAPSALEPATGALGGLRGERPATDLPDLVGNLDSTARVLTDRQGQLAGSITDLAVTSWVLDRRGADLAAALDSLPTTLDSADVGLDALDRSLRKLRDTADPARDIVDETDQLLAEADPTLADARPLVADLRALLADARPSVEELVPAVRNLTAVSDNLRGPVLDRINGPILDTVVSPFVGTGPYAGNGGDYPFYQALGYLASNLNRSARFTDENGAVLSLHFGMGPGSLAGSPMSLEQMFAHLARPRGGGR